MPRFHFRLFGRGYSKCMIQPTSSTNIAPNNPRKIHQKTMIVDNSFVNSDAFVNSHEVTPDKGMRQQLFTQVPAVLSPATSQLHCKEITLEPQTLPDAQEPSNRGPLWTSTPFPCVDLSSEFSQSWATPPTEQFFSDPKLK